MQQTNSLSTNPHSDLSPSFQDWLTTEKAAARSHRLTTIKWATFFVAVIAILLLKEQSTVLADFFTGTGAIAQP